MFSSKTCDAPNESPRIFKCLQNIRLTDMTKDNSQQSNKYLTIDYILNITAAIRIVSTICSQFAQSIESQTSFANILQIIHAQN